MLQRPGYLVVRQLGTIDYQQCWQAMRTFTDIRDGSVADELWLLQHPRVFTQGKAGKAEHVLAPGDIPVIQVDRGGQVTYHGPGQLVVYLLIDLERLGWGVRHFVAIIEQSIIALLAEYGIESVSRGDAPGVYLQSGAKIAALGLRVRHGCCFHGLSLNLDLELEPFGRINPCGYAGQAVARMKDELGSWPEGESQRVAQKLVACLAGHMGYASLQGAHGLPAQDVLRGDTNE
jgi:lipoyl(octanoyl) transferase